MAYVGLLLVIFVDQATRLLVPEGFLQRILPDLPLITALYIGFRAREARPLGLAIVLGVFADCFSSWPLGHFAFLYGAAAYLALRLRRFVPIDRFKSHVAACLVAGFLTSLLALLMAVVTVDGPLGPGFLRSLVRVVVSAVAAPFVFAMWDRSRLFRSQLRGSSYEFAR
jgi:rod shape-determining protein MreD